MGVGGVPSGSGKAQPLLLQAESAAAPAPAAGGSGEGSPAFVPSFMADIFFLTQLLLHVGAVPAVNR